MSSSGRSPRRTELDPVAVRGDLRSFAHAVRSAGLLEHDEPSEQRAVLRPPPERPASDAAYRLGEIAVRVTCYPADIATAFASLAAPALAPDGAVAQTRLALFRAGETFVLTRDDRVVDHLDTAPAARWAMVRQLVLAGTRRSWLALLHAGAVATPAGCLLLSGDSGAGKSSLLAGLVHAGFPFIADDIVPLEERSGLVWPVRLAISIKNGSWPVIGSLFRELEDAPIIHFGGRTMRYFWPNSRAVPVDSAGYPAAAVLFPRYVKDAPAELTALDPAQSLTLLGEGGSLLPTTDAGLAQFLVWWGRLPAYRLSYGRLDDAVAAVRVLTDGLGASRNGAAPAALVAAD